MPQLIALGLIGGAIWFGWRALKREMARINEETRAAEKKSRNITPLEEDEDGVYRIPNDD